MKFIHTADLHLKKSEEKRLDILKSIVQKNRELNADALIIAGDLFDSDKDATLLRPTVKNLFESLGAKTEVLIIPGNHDQASYGPTHDYGENVVQLCKKPFEICEIYDMHVVGIPFQETNFVDCIRNIPQDKATDILIAHGTLYDRSFLFTLLDEDERYMPIYPVHIEGTCRYAALGHLHARNIKVQYKNTQVAYPGSPIALDTKCNVARVALVIDIDKTKCAVNILAFEEVPYWSALEYFVFPGAEDKTLDDIKKCLATLDSEIIMPDIRIRGFLRYGDREFIKKLEEIKERECKKFTDFKINVEQIHSWEKIAENKIVKRFVEMTQHVDDAMRLRMFELIFSVFSDYMA